MSGTLKPPDSGVTVRMYRHGFGDCFLLAFSGTKKNKPCYVLIDCGVKYQSSPGMQNLKGVAENIKKATGGHIDILVITHEHYDHLAGFDQKYSSVSKTIFDSMSFDEVWVAWIAELGNQYEYNPHLLLHFQYQALLEAGNRLKATGIKAYADCADRVFELIYDSVLSGNAFDYVLKRVPLPRYLKPGDPPILVEKIPKIRVYVLGPPADPDYLKDMKPGEDSDVYEPIHFAPDEDLIFSASIMESRKKPLPRVWKDWPKNLHPFDKRLEIGVDEAKDPKLAEKKIGEKLADFFIKKYGFDDKEEGNGDKWRRIDNDWLTAAEALALKLEYVVNNTSLALAIEFIDSGKVLLFSADAQIGNIRSWHEYTWTIEEKPVKIDKLLERTVLYKVGHHGSHNATLKNMELELMKSPDLVAMIPLTDKEETGVGYNGIPHIPLLDELNIKAKGRVIRSDHGIENIVENKPAMLSVQEWDAFKKMTDQTKLYIDLKIED